MPNDHSPNFRYLYFDVQDGFLGLGDKPVKVTIRYLDKGSTHFAFEYDSADPRVSGPRQRFRNGHAQRLPGTGEWKEVSFVVPHALFAGRANGADFRLPAPSERITFGMIGTGRQACIVNMERQLLRMPDAQIVALCDVDGWRLNHAKGLDLRRLRAARAAQ